MLRAGELGRATGWEKSRLSHHIKRMEARRLVERQDCVTDGRGLLVAITDHGRKAIEDAAPGHVQAVREYVIDVLTPEQLAFWPRSARRSSARLTADNCRARPTMTAAANWLASRRRDDRNWGRSHGGQRESAPAAGQA